MSAVKGNINQDFFDQNSEFSTLPEVKKLLQGDPKNASKIMWSIYLIEDPASTYFRIPREERIVEVKREYYNIDLPRYDKLIAEYTRFSMSKEEVMLKFFWDTLDGLVMKLKSSGTTEQLKILEKIPKIWDGLTKIQEKIREEGSKTKIKGNAKEGARESRMRKGVKK
jgi:hypothetical protein